MVKDEKERILATRPPLPTSQALLDAFAKEPARQAARYDTLAKEMMKLLLGVPGAYLAVLSLRADHKFIMQAAGLTLNGLAFASWCGATFAAFRGLFPRVYNVMPDVAYRTDDFVSTGKLTVEEFYRRAARFKAGCLAWSAILFFAGILLHPRSAEYMPRQKANSYQ